MKRFLIWVETASGEFYRAFTWNGDALEGIQRARQEALSRGMHPVDVWATPVANKG
jgi:hypothetical protein